MQNAGLAANVAWSADLTHLKPGAYYMYLVLCVCWSGMKLRGKERGQPLPAKSK